jgi:hypothetical protein
MASHLNRLVQEQVCYNTIKQLSDTALMSIYVNTPGVKKKMLQFTEVFNNHGISEEVIGSMLKDLIPYNIPPGVKGDVRGKMFNDIVENKIKSIPFLQDENKYEIRFEKDCHLKKTGEIPDWYIINYENNKKVIGMNQVDLWGGGAQSNRFDKYINKDDYLCVVLNNVVISERKKNYPLFEKGLMEDRLCWLKNLENILRKRLN